MSSAPASAAVARPAQPGATATRAAAGGAAKQKQNTTTTRPAD